MSGLGRSGVECSGMDWDEVGRNRGAEGWEWTGLVSRAGEPRAALVVAVAVCQYVEFTVRCGVWCMQIMSGEGLDDMHR